MAAYDPLPATGLEIAIVGMAGRFPGAQDLAQFWRNLRDGVESVKRYGDEELRERGVSEALLAHPDYVKAGVPFEGVDLFDAEFFGYTPREAQRLDPQHRLFLECAWEALEHAGHGAGTEDLSVAVFAGAGANVYLLRHLLPRQGLAAGSGIADLLDLVSGNGVETLCTRVAYKLQLRGPAVTVQTACSTSLMAVHLACQSLLAGESDMALAGGVSLDLLHAGGYLYQPGAIFSPDGHCRAFDAAAGGTVLGSGAGVVVLRRLDDALEDGDHIHAVIRATAANNDGADKMGFTAPSVNGQAAVIRAAHVLAGVPADAIGYVEAHGTGTTLGDPIEVAALTQAFRAGTARNGFCALGSVKTNVGHLDCAAGVAGLIKTALALGHRTLPASLHFERPNPAMELASSPFYVNAQTRPWVSEGGPRRAGVSGFGIGGTNVHAVLEEAPPRPGPEAAQDGRWQVLPLSAASAGALAAAAQRLAAHLRAHPQQGLADVAHTLQRGRKLFSHRLAIAADSHEAAACALDQPGHGHVTAPDGAAPEVVFLFPGAGSQHAGMGAALYASQPVFRQEADRCLALLRSRCALDLGPYLFSTTGDADAADRALARMDIGQPAQFVVSYAMARLWMGLGLVPAAMLGHSLGEYVAACLAGVFSLEDALAIVVARARLQQSMAPGAMTSVLLAPDELQPLLEDGCDLAAVNAPQACVLAGPPEAIERAEQALAARGCVPRRLHVAIAAHSAMTEPFMAALESLVAAVPRQAPRIPVISNVTGRVLTDAQATDPGYWAAHLRSTVRFADGMDLLLSVPGRVVLEVGSGDALTSLARQQARADAARGICSSQAHARQQAHNGRQWTQAVAALWSMGLPVDWTALAGPGTRRRVPLPTYAFQRRSYWVEAVDGAPSDAAQEGARRALGDWFYAPVWQRVEPLAPADGTSPGCCLLLGGGACAGALADWLQARGAQVVTVSEAADFARTGARSFAVRRAQRDDLVRLIQAVAGELGPVAHVAHLWNLYAPEPDAALAQGLLSLVALVQALGESGQIEGGRSLSLTVACDASQDVLGGEPLHAEQAALPGLCKVIAQEFPGLDCRVVDLPALVDGALPSGSATAQAIGQEMLRARRGDAALLAAYRGGHRWTLDYAPVARPGGTGQRLRRQGVYLITGGLGGVGFTLARHLAQHWQARLVLLSHAPLPPRAQWPALRADAAGDAPLRLRLQRLAELEALGAEVLVVEADVASAPQMRQAVAQARERFGRIDGAIHSAGRAGGGLLQLRERAQIEQVLAPKIQGTRHLLEALADAPPDFVLLCSALTAIVGGFGQSDYAAANAAMDAIAAGAQGRWGAPVISVNWDVWRDLGMARGQRLPDDMGIEPGQGGELLERILAGPAVAQVLVSSVSLARQVAYLQSAELAERLQPAAAPAQALTRQPRPALDVAYAAPQGATQQRLAEIWSELLGVSPVGIHDNLFDLGGNSLLAVQILSRVRSGMRQDVAPSAFFRSLTIEALAALIDGREGPAHLPAGPELVPVPRGAVLRPAPTQQRIWAFDRLCGDNDAARCAYNEALALSLEGALDAALLRQAVGHIVERHEVLRTTYPEDDQGDPLAVIGTPQGVDMAFVDLASLPAQAAQQRWEDIHAATVAAAFDLATGPLLRASLVRMAPGHHVLSLAIHHIVFDGWSTAVFANELCTIYQALHAGCEPGLAPLKVQYADYALWHERRLEAGAAQARDFWSRYLQGVPLRSSPPHDLPRAAVLEHRGDSLALSIGADLAVPLRAAARAQGVTVFTVLLGAYLLMLHRSTGQSDLVVGTDVAGRGHADLERLIGFFVNVVPVRSRLDDPAAGLGAWLRTLQEGITAVFDHQDLPLDQITSAARVPRVAGGTALLQTLFVLQNTPRRRFELEGLAVSVRPQPLRHSKFDMAVFVHEQPDGFSVDWVYGSQLYRRETAHALSQAWLQALRFLCAETDAAVGAVPLPALSGGPAVNSPVINRKFDKLAALGKKPAAPSAPEQVRISYPSPQRRFPVMLEALDRDIDPVWWATQQRDFIEDKLRTHAGIVFRNFGMQTPQDFERFTEAMEPLLYGAYGDLPKKEGGVNTYRSTPYPENQMILYHNESAHTDRWPRKQWFFCELPAKVGGITPIVDCREMLQRLPAEVVQEMADKGLLYVRHFHPKLDVSWQHFFRSESRDAVEARLARAGIGWQWLEGDILQTRTPAPAVIVHPLTGERSFFNQVQLHHVSCLEPEVRADLVELVGPDRMPRNVFFGDGSPIPDATMQRIGELYEACAVRFDWQRGDVVMLDNMLAAHARDPYEEPRKIVVAMGAMYERDDSGGMRPVRP